jgi:hypothetical protein
MSVTSEGQITIASDPPPSEMGAIDPSGTRRTMAHEFGLPSSDIHFSTGDT